MGDSHWAKVVDRVSEAMERAKALEVELAAKDRDIAELKRVAGEWAKAYAYVTDILPLDPRNFARDPVCPMNLAEQDRHRVDVLRGERDQWKHDATALLEINKSLLRTQENLEASEACVAALKERISTAEHCALNAIALRDEARECVGRLWREGTAMLLAATGKEEFGKLADALDATPEHLR